MKVLVVSGFLGAGKTTFIKELASRTGKKFVILENEYGALGIDGDLLKEAGMGSDNIWEMSSGCICCSKKGDFAASILTIANTINPEYLIIEPTGVGMLSNVISHIKKVEYERIQILSPITIVDGESIHRYRQEFGEIYDDQIRSSGQVLISKMEKSGYEQRLSTVEQIKAINPDASIVSEHYTSMPKSWWDNILLKLLDGNFLIKETDEINTNFDSIILENVSMFNPSEFVYLLEDIIRGFYGNIIRAKGAFMIGSIGLKFDLVDNKYSILSCDTIDKSSLVFIGKDINKKKLEKKFFKLDKKTKMRFRR